MKNLKQFTALALVMFMSLGIWAQQTKNQAFWIHEDRVKPSMLSEYEKVSKDFVQMCRENNLQDMQWSIAQIEDGTFMSITPIEGLADIQNMSFASLIEKVGQEKFEKMMSDFNKCYDSHGDYVAVLNTELSFMPEGLTTDTPGENYRVWHRMNVTPSNVANLRGKMKELKSLFSTKGSKMYYRIYHTGFGNMGNNYVAVISAKDAADYARKSSDNQKLLGEEGQKLFEEMFEYVEAYDVKHGGMRPDLAYNPSPELEKITKD